MVRCIQGEINVLVRFNSHDEAQEFIKRESAKIEHFAEESDEACRLVDSLSSVICREPSGGLVHRIQINYENGDTAFLDTSMVAGI